MCKKVIVCCLSVLSVLSFVIQPVDAKSKKTPNVIYIYASDLGKGMLSAYGQKHFTTPNIDALINSGVSFEYAYGGSVSPYARASLMTGYNDCKKDKWRITRGGSYIREDTVSISRSESDMDSGSILLPENDLYLPQVFRNAGYATAQIGMLGFGNISTRKQMAQYGWDYYYGYLDHLRSRGYYPPFLFENDRIVMIDGNTRRDCGRSFIPETDAAYAARWNMEGKKTYSPDLFIDKAIGIIREFKDKPFFLMYSTPLPHGPVSIPAVHPEVANNDALTQVEKEFASMVKKLDEHVGIIMSELRTLGMEENTIVVFASDNGHDIAYQQMNRIESPYRNLRTGEIFDNLHNKYYSDRVGDVFNGNAGLAGLKSGNLEGGISIPLVFYWKGRLKKRVSGEFVSNYDFLPTMAELLNVRLQTKKDGISILPALMKGRKLSGNRHIYICSEDGPTIISSDGWKLRYHRMHKKYELYNLKRDREERYDVTLRFPEKAEELKALLLDECNGDVENGILY